MGLVAYEYTKLKFKPHPSIIPQPDNHLNLQTGNKVTSNSNTKGKVNTPDIQGKLINNTPITGEKEKLTKGATKQQVNINIINTPMKHLTQID